MSTVGEVKHTRTETHEAMLQEVLSRPGVREVMEIYENWHKVDRALSTYRQATRRHGRVTTSNRTSAR